MRYKGSFPYGSICEITSEDCYSASQTQIEDDMDDVIEKVKKYHEVFCELTKEVFRLIMDEFKKQGYLTDGPNKLVFSVSENKTKIGVYKLGKHGEKIKI